MMSKFIKEFISMLPSFSLKDYFLGHIAHTHFHDVKNYIHGVIIDFQDMKMNCQSVKLAKCFDVSKNKSIFAPE